MCDKELADLGFIKNQGRALCHDCNAKVKAEGLGKYGELYAVSCPYIYIYLKTKILN